MRVEECYAIIVAGGSGTRMGANMPKQFMELDGKPILFHTITKFTSIIPKQNIVLVLPFEQHHTWKSICADKRCYEDITVVSGGTSRTKSVQNGLKHWQGKMGLVAIHDGVRPFVTAEIIKKSYKLAFEKGSAVASVPAKDSLRIVDGDSSQALDRSKIKLIQTPQTFQLELINGIMLTDNLYDATDEASQFDHAGLPVTLFEGSYNNIKITTPEDMIMAEAILRSQATV